MGQWVLRGRGHGWGAWGQDEFHRRSTLKGGVEMLGGTNGSIWGHLGGLVG